MSGKSTGIDGNSKSLDSLRSGELVLVWLEVKASQNVPDALVVDLLPAGLELENQNLANGSASLQDSGSEVANLLNQMQQADIQHVEFRDDRFVAAVAVNEGQPVTLVYLARAVTPGTYQFLSRRWNQCMFRSGARPVRQRDFDCQTVNDRRVG